MPPEEHGCRGRRGRPWLVCLIAAGALLGSCKGEQSTAAVSEPVPGSAQTVPEQPPAQADAGAEARATTGATGSGAGVAHDTGTAEAQTDGAQTEEPVPSEPRRVLILGDSFAATGFGVLLQKRLAAHEHIECFRRGKSSSGLARPDFFDWMKESRRLIELRNPDLVIVIIGGNDGQDLLVAGRGKGKRVRWNAPEWEAAYRRRIQEFLVGIAAPDRKTLWLELPPTRTNIFERKIVLIRSIQEDVMTGMRGAGEYLDTTAMFTDEDGNVMREAVVEGRRRPQQLRADDGIHFTMAGSKFFADRVYPEVLRILGLVPAD